MKPTLLTIRDLFRLTDGKTIIACDRPADFVSWQNRRVTIVSNKGELRQDLTIAGLCLTLKQIRHIDQIAVETFQVVNLADEDVKTGNWNIDIQ